MSATPERRPPSTRAQIVTAVCAAFGAVALLVGAMVVWIVATIGGQIIDGIAPAINDSGAAIGVPISEAACLHYASTVLELNDGGMDHDAIVGVIDGGVQAESASPDELAELRELSITSNDACGPVRDILDAAGR